MANLLEAHAATTKILTEGEHMAKHDNDTFIKVKDSKGDKYLCPIDTSPNHSSNRAEVNDDCIEEDVIGRYAGKINIRPS